jgi:alkanesulfonate monooxygenase SsuD/methylene tetrahydromethanopterin reductase-like flavin-dependent oxidoreductase (luciferase family)
MDFGLFLEFPCRDGMTEPDAFAECFALADEAEVCGVDSVWLAEYHFSPISVLSAPVTVASAIAARTRSMRIGLAVALLPLGQPVRIAEEIATLDHISQGRVEFGIGRGTFPETHDGFNSPFAESRDRFDEYLDIIIKAWTTENSPSRVAITRARTSASDPNRCRHLPRRFASGSPRKRRFRSSATWAIRSSSIRRVFLP